MAIPKVTTSGVGTFGDIGGSWSAQESALPLVAGTSDGETPSATIKAAKTAMSKFLIDQPATVIHPDLGIMPGNIKSVDPNDELTVNFTMQSLMNLFNVERVVPAVSSGMALGAVDLCIQLLGGSNKRCSLTYPRGKFWSFNGHDVGFDVNGDRLSAVDNRTSLIATNLAGVSGVDVDGVSNSAVISQYGSTPGELDAYAVEFSLGSFDSNVAFQHFVFEMRGGSSFSFADFTDSHHVDISLDYDGTHGVYSLSVDYSSASTSGNLANYSANAWYRFVVTMSATSIVVSVSSLDPVADPSNNGQISLSNLTGGTSVFQLVDRATGYGPNGIKNMYMLGSAVDVKAALAAVSSYHAFGPIGISFQQTGTPYPVEGGSPFSGGKLNLFDYLKQVTAATQNAFGFVNGKINLEKLAINKRRLSLENVVGKPKISESSQGSSRSVTITNQNTSIAASSGSAALSILYDAQESGDSYQISSGEVKIVRAELKGFASSISNPLAYNWSVVTTASDEGAGAAYKRFRDHQNIGSFMVSDANGLPLTPADWYSGGGRITAALVDAGDSVDLTFYGPLLDIPGAPGPYSFSISDGTTDFQTFRLFGRGVVSDPTEITLYTGVDEDKVTSDDAPSVDNLALGSLAEVMDAGVWVIDYNSSPTLTLTFTIPTAELAAFGLGQNSFVQFANKNWRVNSVSFGSPNSTCTAEVVTTIDDYDTVWAGATLDARDAEWTGYTLDQRSIESLRKSS